MVRTLHAVGETRASFSAAEGVASVDYLFVDPQLHESLRINVAMLRAGSPRARLDIYLKYGDWPTTLEFDALLQPAQSSPSSGFVLQPNRLFNERLCIMVVGRGDAWVEYSLNTSSAPNFVLGVVLLLVLVLVALVAVIVLRSRRQGVQQFLDPAPLGDKSPYDFVPRAQHRPAAMP